MSVDTRAGTLPVQPGELDTLAGELFGKPYRLLDDAQAGEVWDAIAKTAREAREEARDELAA